MRISDWSSDVCSSGQPDRVELDRLMTRLETNIEAFQANTKEARTVTSDYGIELEQHVTDLEQLEKTGRIVSRPADLAQVILDRTQIGRAAWRERVCNYV